MSIGAEGGGISDSKLAVSLQQNLFVGLVDTPTAHWREELGKDVSNLIPLPTYSSNL